MKKLLCVAAAASLFGAAAAAQKVYRCGPEGRTYQQAPCNDGKPIDASDARTPEQRAAAKALAASEARRAAQFDRDNLPASAPEGRKAKPPKAPKASPGASPAAASSPSSVPKSGKLEAQDPSKPLIVRLPAKPKAAASAASTASR